MPRHAAPRDVPPGSASAMSRTAWRRVRAGLTAGVFAVATAAGITVGLSGTSVSPVAPATTITAAGAALAAPTAPPEFDPVRGTRPDDPGAGRGRRGGRGR